MWKASSERDKTIPILHETREKQKNLSTRERIFFHRQNEKRWEMLIAFSNVESSCFSHRRSLFACVNSLMLQEKIAFLLIFLACDGELADIYALVSQDDGEFSMSWRLKFRVFHSVQLFLLVGPNSYSWFVCVLVLSRHLFKHSRNFVWTKKKWKYF